jgi:hypothetical protein
MSRKTFSIVIQKMLMIVFMDIPKFEVAYLESFQQISYQSMLTTNILLVWTQRRKRPVGTPLFSLNLKSTPNAILLPPDDQQRPETIDKSNDEQSDHCHRPSTLRMISESVCLAFYHQILFLGIIGRLDFFVQNILKNPPSYTITGLNSVCQYIIIEVSHLPCARWFLWQGNRLEFFP